MRKSPRKREPSRLLALSDGLFATVLTILVLDLRAPDALSSGTGALHGFTSWIGPRLFAYLVTFIVAGNYWLSHHRDFDHVDGYDRGLLGYNLMFLLFIGLLPFSTAAVSAASLSSGLYSFYWAVYAGNLMLAGVMLALTWSYAASHQLVKAETTASQVRSVGIRHTVTPVIFVISIVVQYAFPRVLLGPYVLLLIPVAMLVVDRIFPPPLPARQGESLVRRLLWGSGRILPWLLAMGLAIWALNA